MKIGKKACLLFLMLVCLLLSGCAHGGIVNILARCREAAGIVPDAVVITVWVTEPPVTISEPKPFSPSG